MTPKQRQIVWLVGIVAAVFIVCCVATAIVTVTQPRAPYYVPTPTLAPSRGVR